MKALALTTLQFVRLEGSFRDWLEALGYAPTSVYHLPNAVREFFYWLETSGQRGLQAVTADEVQTYFEHLRTRGHQRREGALSNRYLAKHWQALSLLRRYLHESGQGTLRLPEEMPLRWSPKPITVLTVEEVKQLYAACSDDVLGLRDRAMLALFYGCGLRRSEGAALNRGDILPGKRLIYVRRGKAYRERYVPMATGVLRDVETYLGEARPRLAWSQEQALFVSQRGRRMQGQSLLLRLKRLTSRVSSLAGREVGLHTLRHSIATHLLLSGMPLVEIARFLGHRSLESTQRYTHLTNEPSSRHAHTV